MDFARGMAHPPVVDRETLREIVEDVLHDLGKHLLLPLRLLPAEADGTAVREAARTALLRTRRGPDGAQAAAVIWAGFETELAEALGEPLADAGPPWADLAAAMARALAWAERLDGSLDRAALTADLAAVGDAARAALDALDEDDEDDGCP